MKETSIKAGSLYYNPQDSFVLKLLIISLI